MASRRGLVTARTRSWRASGRCLHTPAASRLVVKERQPRVVVGMSGGVDSSVSALLLQRQGYEVVGVHMRNWSEDDVHGSCASSDADLTDVQRVCAQLGIEHHVVDFVPEYWNHVFVPYLERFRGGGTPNPDVFCNREIKFSRFRRMVEDRFDADFVATGHYARLAQPSTDNVTDAATTAMLVGVGAVPCLVKAADPVKDQTYFLSAVEGTDLVNVKFPVGGLLKSRVREIAQEAGLSTAAKRDSYGICFVGKRRFAEFLEEHMRTTPAEFVDVDTGARIGEASHGGLEGYTVGQRARIPNMQQPYFVSSKDVAKRVIYVAKGAEHPALLSRELWIRADEMFWVLGTPPAVLTQGNTGLRLACKVRSRQERDVPCSVTLQSSGLFRVVLDEAIFAVTPQQMAVFYWTPGDGDTMVHRERVLCLGTLTGLLSPVIDLALTSPTPTNKTPFSKN